MQQSATNHVVPHYLGDDCLRAAVHIQFQLADARLHAVFSRVLHFSPASYLRLVGLGLLLEGQATTQFHWYMFTA